MHLVKQACYCGLITWNSDVVTSGNNIAVQHLQTNEHMAMPQCLSVSILAAMTLFFLESTVNDN